jgi:hypothetical protein
LVLGKRGARAGWVGEEGERIYHRSIAHAKEPGAICWRPAEADELPEEEPARKGRVEVWSTENLLELLGDKQLTFSEMRERALSGGWASRTFVRKWQHLKDLKWVEESKAEPGEWRARKRS